MLLGLPSSTNSYANIAASYAEQSITWGFYFQDDWKATRNLTLNLGLRWEFESPLTERYNRSVRTFDPNYVPPFATAATSAYAAAGAPAVPAAQFGVRGGLTFADENNRGLYTTPKKNLLPRVGFAYQLGAKSVVRGGFGIYQGFLGERRGDVIQTGFSQQTPFIPFAQDNITIQNTLSNPFPTGLIPAVGSSLGGQTGLGQNLTFFNQYPDVSKAYRWQMDIQRELPGSVLLELAYVGNKGIDVEVTRNLNALPNQYLSTLNMRDNAQNAYLTAAVANPFVNLSPPRPVRHSRLQEPRSDVNSSCGLIRSSAISTARLTKVIRGITRCRFARTSGSPRACLCRRTTPSRNGCRRRNS